MYSNYVCVLDYLNSQILVLQPYQFQVTKAEIFPYRDAQAACKIYRKFTRLHKEVDLAQQKSHRKPLAFFEVQNQHMLDYLCFFLHLSPFEKWIPIKETLESPFPLVPQNVPNRFRDLEPDSSELRVLLKGSRNRGIVLLQQER